MEHSRRLDIFSATIFIVSVILMVSVDMHNDAWRALVIGMFAGSIIGWVARRFWLRT